MQNNLFPFLRLGKGLQEKVDLQIMPSSRILSLLLLSSNRHQIKCWLQINDRFAHQPPKTP